MRVGKRGEWRWGEAANRGEESGGEWGWGGASMGGEKGASRGNMLLVRYRLSVRCLSVMQFSVSCLSIKVFLVKCLIFTDFNM